MKNVQIRIGNLKFGKATYIGEEPEMPAYHIDVIERNENYFYFKKGYFIEDDQQPGHYRYNGPNEQKREWTCLYDKSCFENEEYSWAVAAFEYNKRENCYELNLFRWSELLDDKYAQHREDFWKLLKAINDSGIFDEQVVNQ